MNYLNEMDEYEGNFVKNMLKIYNICINFKKMCELLNRMDLVIKMVEWDKRRKNLKDWQWNTMKAITEGKYPLEGKYIYACLMNLKVLKRAGFVEE